MDKDWLLCDVPIHTAPTDGVVPRRKVVNLNTEEGSDLICIFDHVFDAGSSDRYEKQDKKWSVPPAKFPETLRPLGSEARHAWSQYGMLVISGVERTNESGGYHILGVDVKECIDRALPVHDIVGPKKSNDVVDHK